VLVLVLVLVLVELVVRVWLLLLCSFVLNLLRRVAATCSALMWLVLLTVVVVVVDRVSTRYCIHGLRLVRPRRWR
jgi:hypothetical protein